MEAVDSETRRRSDLPGLLLSIPASFKCVEDNLLLRDGSASFPFGFEEGEAWIVHDSSKACFMFRLPSGRCGGAMASFAIDEWRRSDLLR